MVRFNVDAAIHNIIKKYMSKRQQGYCMSELRELLGLERASEYNPEPLPDAWVVVDDAGGIPYSAATHIEGSALDKRQAADYAWQRCNEQIQDWIENGVPEAARWVIRPMIYQHREVT